MASSPKESQSSSNGGALNPRSNCLDVLLLHQRRECAAATTNSLASPSDLLGNAPTHPLGKLCQALDKALEICGGATDEALLAMTRPAPSSSSSSSSMTVRDTPPRTQ